MWTIYAKPMLTRSKIHSKRNRHTYVYRYAHGLLDLILACIPAVDGNFAGWLPHDLHWYNPSISCAGLILKTRDPRFGPQRIRRVYLLAEIISQSTRVRVGSCVSARVP